MGYMDLTEAVEQYRTEDRSLESIAAEASVSKEELVDELRSQGVSLRDEDDTGGTTTRS